MGLLHIFVWNSDVIVCKQAYDPQTGYDISYFRPQIDETVRGQGLPSPHEVNLPAIMFFRCAK
jgi:hypothetical protein